MKITDALQNITQLFLDTAPVIYYVEKNPSYIDLVKTVFDHIDSGLLTAVTSPVTLAECLVEPYRSGAIQLQVDFSDLIVYGNHTIFTSINQESARQAAELRARYNLTLTDALQVSIALGTGCQALLTNDNTLKRVSEISILLLNELSL
ncbi:MAG: PIN domain-containing protein [Acidobacteria bacterium]|nr:PIN domain-containing protein [Acidobacteriota bacterium]